MQFFFQISRSFFHFPVHLIKFQYKPVIAEKYKAKRRIKFLLKKRRLKIISFPLTNQLSYKVKKERTNYVLSSPSFPQPVTVENEPIKGRFLKDPPYHHHDDRQDVSCRFQHLGKHRNRDLIVPFGVLLLLGSWVLHQCVLHE